MKRLFHLALILFLPTFIFAQTSQLVAGDWYKIGVTQSGIYKIDATFLKNAGVNVGSVNPKTISLFGNGGGMLPQKNSDFRNTNLIHNAIFISGEDDNKFDDGDYILFYAEGPHKIIYDSAQKVLAHQYNIYSDTSYYFLNIGNYIGNRVLNSAVFQGSATEISAFDDYFFYEKELTNLLNSGREWFGEIFNNTTEQTFSFTVPGIISNSDLKVTTSLLATKNGEEYPADESDFAIILNGQNIGKENFPSFYADKYSTYGSLQKSIFAANTAQTGIDPNQKITLTFEKSGNAAVGYLNYLEMNLKRELKMYGTQTSFRSFETLKNNIKFSIKSTDSQLKIWDITNPLQAHGIPYTSDGSTAVFSVSQNDTLKDFIMFSGNSFDAPAFVGKVANQAIQNIDVPDLLIITPDALISEANRLADFRKAHDGLTVFVATTSQVYNEFSSGKRDVSAIRDYARSLYLRNSKLKYLLLFGDASYDYKSRVSKNFSDTKNTVPVYESRESLQPIYTYSSDDYFGFLEDNEGEWTENSQGDHTLDIGVGRLPVQNITQAKAMVNKLIYYTENAKELGKWREKISFVADNGDYNVHQSDAEKLTVQVTNKNLPYNINKIYLDNYTYISHPDYQEVPDAVTEIQKAVNEGSLIVNYTGHGGEIGWAQEKILTISQIQNWRNINNMPLFVTATCEFGRYDNPLQTSGAELAISNPSGGAIGLLTTTRPVYSSTNFAINTAFYNAVFQPVSGQMPRLGDVMKATKNNSLSGVNNRNFALLGDPSMLLAYPKQNINIIKINAKTGSSTDTLKALSTVKIDGEIQDQSGSKIPDFSGTAFISVFDKDVTASTLGQSDAPMNYQLQNMIIYEGKSTVKNGSFSFDFAMPKDIDYRMGKGKIIFYAQSDSSVTDAGGLYRPMIGGNSEDAAADNTPPEIRLFMNNENFVSGGATNMNTTLIAKIKDENGINVSTTGLGHQITAYLDNNTDSLIILNDYFTTDLDTYKSGSLNYGLKNLKSGKHTISLKAWDNFNNSAISSLDFVVVEDQKIHLSNVFNYPNPFNPDIESTIFRFEQDYPGDDLDVTLEILSIRGDFIKTISFSISQSQTLYNGYRWDGKNNGEKIGSGLYVYRLTVRSKVSNVLGQHVGKLSIIR